MTLANPIYLWSFMGLLLPLAVHLWSKRDARVIKVGSIKFLEGTDAAKRNAIHFNEFWLFLLRALAILILAFILSGPGIIGRKIHARITYLIEPALVSDGQLKDILDGLGNNNLHLLKTGFPEYDPAMFSQTSDAALKKTELPPNYWQLAQEMQQLDTDSLVVFTRALSSGIYGKRPLLHKNIKWIVIDPKPITSMAISARRDGEKIQLLLASSDHKKLTYSHKKLDLNDKNLQVNPNGDSILVDRTMGSQKLKLDSLKPLIVEMVFDKGFTSEKEYIEASLRALVTYLDRPINLKFVHDRESLPSRLPDLLVWLRQDSLPNYKGKILTYAPNTFAKAIITTTPDKNRFALTTLLNAENTVEQHLPEQLLKLLDQHHNLKENRQLFDKRQITIDELKPNYLSGKSRVNRAEVLDITPWLWALLFIVLLTERVISRKRNQ